MTWQPTKVYLRMCTLKYSNEMLVKPEQVGSWLCTKLFTYIQAATVFISQRHALCVGILVITACSNKCT